MGIKSVNTEMILDSLEHLRAQAEESAHKTKQARKTLQRSKEAEKSRKNDVPTVNEESGKVTPKQPTSPFDSASPSDVEDIWADLDSLKPFHIE
jgi:hypothetical protein